MLFRSNSGDMAGILMIAAQTLEKRTAENADLKLRLEALERMIGTYTLAVKAE